MSAHLSTVPPSRGPGIRRCSTPRGYEPESDFRASPRELKAEAIRLQPLTGMGKRETARSFARKWETVRGWLDPRALDRTPPREFVRFLRLTIERDALVKPVRAEVG